MVQSWRTALAAVVVLAGASWSAADDDWQAQFRVGEQVLFSISGSEDDFQTCTVTENRVGGMSRVRCGAFKQWAAGSYIVYGSDHIRKVGGAPEPAADAPAADAGEPEAAAGDADGDWQSRYRVGQQVRFSVSEYEADFQTCTVSENPPGGLLRVRCKAFKQWPAGSFIVYSRANIRPLGAAPAARPAAPPPATGTAPPPTRGRDVPRQDPRDQPGRAPAGAALPAGEYACYGTGGRSMEGLHFRVAAGGRYTDLDGLESGTVTVNGSTLSFRGGHMDGMTGRRLPNGNFAIGAQAECERVQ